MNLNSLHPSDAQLMAFNRGETAEEELGDIALHLDICSECVGRLEELSATDKELSRLRQAARPTPASSATVNYQPTANGPESSAERETVVLALPESFPTRRPDRPCSSPSGWGTTRFWPR